MRKNWNAGGANFGRGDSAEHRGRLRPGRGVNSGRDARRTCAGALRDGGETIAAAAFARRARTRREVGSASGSVRAGAPGASMIGWSRERACRRPRCPRRVQHRSPRAARRAFCVQVAGRVSSASGLASKALLAVRVHCAAPDAAIFGRCLLHRLVTSRTSADLERSDLLQTVSDRQRFPSKTFTAAAATPSLSPNALLNYARPLSCVKHWRSLSTPRHHQED